MSSLTRLLAFSLLMLTVLVIAGLAAQSWLQRQDQRLTEVANRQLESQLEAAVALTRQAGLAWDNQKLQEISALTGAELRFEVPASAGPPANLTGVAVPLDDGRWLVVEGRIVPRDIALKLFQRVLIGLGVFALLLAAALVFTMALRTRQKSNSRSPFHPQTNDIGSLSALARNSIRQQAELDKERDDRLRAEADARQRLQLLNLALEEKIHIGRDLHDGVIQSLYAAGLTLESARQLADTKPEMAAQQIDSTLNLINRTIQEIRTYIAGLSSDRVRSDSLSQALREVVNDIRAGRPTDIELKIDDKTASHLSDSQVSETIQIVREAVSNALRHGGARQIRVQLTSVDSRAELAILDDGTGFDVNGISSDGHGLSNLRARALNTEGSFNLTSSPGHGTAIRVSWAIPLLAT